MTTHVYITGPMLYLATSKCKKHQPITTQVIYMQLQITGYKMDTNYLVLLQETCSDVLTPCGRLSHWRNKLTFFTSPCFVAL